MPKKSTKKPIGRPPKFDDPQKLQSLVDNYFTHCNAGQIVRYKDKRGEYHEENLTTIPSVIGLALFLGFPSTHALWNYTQRIENKLHSENEGHSEFSDIITRAKNRIAEIKLNLGLQGIIDPHITRLDLAANHGMSEKRELTLSVEDNRTVDPAMLPIINRARDAILAEMIEQERKQLQAPDIIDIDDDETLSDTD